MPLFQTRANKILTSVRRAGTFGALFFMRLHFEKQILK
jgi:hypothetical protein